jgi:cytochrome c oxidase subunit 2
MGLLAAIVVWVIALAMSIPFVTQTWWMPDAITETGREIDSAFMFTLIGTGIIFLLAQAALGYAVWRFGRRSDKPAADLHGNNMLEWLWTTAAAVIFVGLTFWGYSVWAETRFIKARTMQPSPDRLVVEVTGQQFVWNMRYAGEDNQFGPTQIELIDDAGGNPVGVDRSEPTGADDIMVPEMRVPVNREVEVVLKSKDVLHNFFVPELRIKLDTVPGLVGVLRFTPDSEGTFEIVCSELCGLGHYKMRSFLHVVSEDEYQAWIEEQASYLF